MPPKVSAISVANFVHYIEGLYGQDKMREIIGRLTPEEQNVFLFPSFNLRWFESTLLVHLYEKAEECIPDKKGRLVEEAVAEMARNDLKGRYKHFLPFITPKAILKNISKVYRLYNDTGTMTAENPKKNMLIVKLADYPQAENLHDRNISGYFYGVLELMKLKNIQIRHVACVLKGQPFCQWEMTWEK